MLGSDPYQLATAGLDAVHADLEYAHALAVTTDLRQGRASAARRCPGRNGWAEGSGPTDLCDD